jgi:alkanesulfonate monooxygenase SsuD/methylene tetrahydromethanopterin reductase-like flavin-dependent oxidoreductase (luciferase family)
MAAGNHPRPERRLGYVMSSEQFTIDKLVKLGEAAEKAGFHAAWSSDHFQPWQPNEGHSSFAWATLAAVSQRTSRMTLGISVVCQALA